MPARISKDSKPAQRGDKIFFIATVNFKFSDLNLNKEESEIKNYFYLLPNIFCIVLYPILEIRSKMHS